MSRAVPSVQTLSSDDELAGRFRVVRFLGAGAVGEVYECEDVELGGRVAIKGLRPELAADAEAVARLRRELHLTRAVTHPNVCRTYDAFVDQGGRLFLTMELLAGETLEAHLARRARLPPDEAVAVLRQIADGLAAAHAACVVHRDLKTGNVFLVGEGDERRVVVTDFGLARAELSGGASLTGTGEIVGSPAYMAPEQVRGEPATPATDVYALGVVAYELVTGELPFQGETGFVTAVKRLTEPPPPPRRRVPELPAVWDEAVLRCLAAEPAERFADPRELPRRLEERRRSCDAAARAGAARRDRRRGGAALAAGLALVAVALATGWGSRQRASGFGERVVTGLPASAVAETADAVDPAGAVGAEAGGASLRSRPLPPSAPTATETAASPEPAPAPPSPEREAAERAMAAGNEHFRAGRIAEARAAYETALPLWRSLGVDDRRAAALNNIGNTLAIEGSLGEATPYYERALELRRRAGDEAMLSRALEGLGRHLFRLGESDGARRSFEEAVVLARRGGRHEEAARVLLNLSAVLRLEGDAGQAERAVRTAIELYEEAGDALSAAAAKRSLGELLFHGGRLTAAAEALEVALAALVEADHAPGEAAARGALASTLDALGRSGAERHLERARELWRQTGSRAPQCRVAFQVAGLRLAAGDLAGARAELLPAVAELEEIGGNQGLHQALEVLSELQRLEGDATAARASVDRALGLARDLELPASVAHGLLRLARLALDDGLPVEAIALARAAAADLARFGQVDDARRAALVLAEAHLVSGDPAAARRELAASGAAASEDVRVRWRTELLGARIQALDGDPAAAAGELARLESAAADAGWAVLAVEAALARVRPLAAAGDVEASRLVARAVADAAAARGLGLHARLAAAFSGAP